MRQPVILERTVFQLAASGSRLPCPCGKSALTVSLMGDQVRLTVPCLFCEQEHTVSCSTAAFLQEKTLAFSCANSGLDCCYVGEEGAVYAATARLEQAVDKLDQAPDPEEERPPVLGPMVMEEILSELRDIAARGGVSCACGSKTWTFRVNYSSGDRVCGQCGAEMRIPAATADDIDDLCCKTTRLIRGRAGT